MFLAIAAIDSSPQPTKSEKIFSYIKVGLPTSIGLVQQPVQIVVRYRSHNLTLFVGQHAQHHLPPPFEPLSTATIAIE